jgi:hypothetical protein
MKASKILGEEPRAGEFPAGTRLKLLCSVCSKEEWALLSDADADELKRRPEFYSVCARHMTPRPDDLYDRRLRVFYAVRDVLALMYTVVRDDQQLLKLMAETREVDFLFGPEIKDYIEIVWRRAMRLSDVNKRLNEMLNTGAPAEARKPLADIEREEIEWATAETRTVADRFKSYLDMSKL